MSEALESHDLDDESVDEVANAQAFLIDTIANLEAIATQDGISRDMVVAVEDHLPENIPLLSFTKNPTATNIDVGIEALGKQGWGLIGIIIAAIIALVAKLLSWLFNRSNAGGSIRDAEKATRIAKDTKQRIEKLQRDAPDALERATQRANDSANSQNWNRLRQSVSIEITGLVKRVFLESRLIYDDLLESIEESSMMIYRMSTGRLVIDDMLLPIIERKLAKIQGISTKIVGDFDSEDITKQSDTLAGVMTGIAEVVEDLRKEPASINFDVQKYVDTMAREEAGLIWHTYRELDIDPFAHTQDKVEKRLENVRGTLKNVDEGQIKLVRSGLKLTPQEKAALEAKIQKVVNGILTECMAVLRAIDSYTKVRITLLREEQATYRYLVDYNRNLR